MSIMHAIYSYYIYCGGQESLYIEVGKQARREAEGREREGECSYAGSIERCFLSITFAKGVEGFLPLW